jgi:hypothetical protein
LNGLAYQGKKAKQVHLGENSLHLGYYFSQFHRLLKDLDAPVYYVQDWGKDLPELLKNLTDEELQRKQDELKVWHAKFVRHLRLLLFKLIRTHFEPEDDDYN